LAQEVMRKRGVRPDTSFEGNFVRMSDLTLGFP
jgi:hypothetical protein